MMRIKKKGEWGKLQELILAAIFAVIIIGFLLPQISNIITTGSNTQACKTWVALQSRAKIGDYQVAKLKSPCITDRKELPAKQDEMYQTLAESMYDCWDMYGQGKIDFFSNTKSFWKDSESYCYICSRSDVKENTLLNLDDFGAYVNSHNPPNTQNTYAQFLLESDNAKLDFGAAGQKTMELNENTPLYTIFHVIKKPDYSDLSNKGIWEKAAGKTLGVVITGTILGKNVPGVSTLLTKTGPVGWALAAVAVVGTNVYFLRTDAGDFYPSLAVMSGKNLVEAGCDNVYNNPKKNILESISKKNINEFT